MQYQRFATILLIVSLFAAAGLAQNATTTTTTVTSDMNLPVVGLATSETAQVNVVNLAAASPSGTAASCVGTVTFYNSAGSAIGSATSFTIGTGQISSASIAFGKTGATARTSIRAAVTLTETLRSGVPCSLATNVETYDTTSGVTHVHIETGSPVIAQTAPSPFGH